MPASDDEHQKFVVFNVIDVWKSKTMYSVVFDWIMFCWFQNVNNSDLFDQLFYLKHEKAICCFCCFFQICGGFGWSRFPRCALAVIEAVAELLRNQFLMDLARGRLNRKLELSWTSLWSQSVIISVGGQTVVVRVRIKISIFWSVCCMAVCCRISGVVVIIWIN